MGGLGFRGLGDVAKWGCNWVFVRRKKVSGIM